MNPILKTGRLHGVRVAGKATVRSMRDGSQRGMNNPAVDPFPSCVDARPGYRSRRRLAILPRQTILSRWSLAAGHACLEATHCPARLGRAEALTTPQGPGERTGRPTTETTITGA